MGTINFTKEHMARLTELATDMLFKNDTIKTTLGYSTVIDILHLTTIESLKTIYKGLKNAIEKMEDGDEWATTDYERTKLDDLKLKKEFINLVIGYKRYNAEKESEKKKRLDIEKQIKALEEAEKTPADRLKELRDKLAAMDSAEEF